MIVSFSVVVSAGKTDDRSHLERTTEVADNDDNKAQDDEFDRDEINPSYDRFETSTAATTKMTTTTTRCNDASGWMNITIGDENDDDDR